MERSVSEVKNQKVTRKDDSCKGICVMSKPATPIHRAGPIPANLPLEERQERALALKPIVTATKDLVEETRHWIPEGEEILFDEPGWGDRKSVV